MDAGEENKVYRLVVDSPYLPALKTGLGVEILPLREVAEKFVHEVSGFKQVRACILYGSVARGAASPESDIYVLVLVSKRTEELEARVMKIATDLSHSTGCSIMPTITLVGKFRKMLAAGHEFAVAVKGEGIALLKRGRAWPT